MDKLINLIIGFASVTVLAAFSIAFGGQVQSILGNDVFVPVMSVATLILAFSLPDGGSLAPRVGLVLGLIFCFQAMIFFNFERTLRIWNMTLIAMVTVLAALQVSFGWAFASRYYGLYVAAFCVSVSGLFLASAWLAIFRKINGSGQQADFRLNIFVFCGLAWGAFPYLGELP